MITCSPKSCKIIYIGDVRLLASINYSYLIFKERQNIVLKENTFNCYYIITHFFFKIDTSSINNALLFDEIKNEIKSIHLYNCTPFIYHHHTYLHKKK